MPFFGDDGSLSGNAGCNNYSTSYTIDGDNISINPGIATTRMACAENVMSAVETAYLAALPTAATYAVQGDGLELRHVTGSLIASYTAAAPRGQPLPWLAHPGSSPVTTMAMMRWFRR
ncbi:MAG: META domain-containing protein [Dehalococcoidia bacterium]|nr:META domain-containing protein [Dehalococcoidia bacterium]